MITHQPTWLNDVFDLEVCRGLRVNMSQPQLQALVLPRLAVPEYGLLLLRSTDIDEYVRAWEEELRMAINPELYRAEKRRFVIEHKAGWLHDGAWVYSFRSHEGVGGTISASELHLLGLTYDEADGLPAVVNGLGEIVAIGDRKPPKR